MKRCLISLIAREIQIKTAVRYHFKLIRKNIRKMKIGGKKLTRIKRIFGTVVKPPHGNVSIPYQRPNLDSLPIRFLLLHILKGGR